MKQLFKIDESEKRRILEMHENATKRNYLMEGKMAKCIKDDPTTEGSASKAIGVLGADNLCSVLGQDPNKDIGQGFYGEFYYIGQLDPPKGNAKNYVTFYTFTAQGSVYELCNFGIMAGAKEWSALNTNNFFMSYNPSNDPRFVAEIKADKTPNKQKSIDALTTIVSSAEKFDPTKFADYLINLVNTPPAKTAKSDLIVLAVQNARTVPQGQKLLSTGILASLNNAVPQAAAATGAPATGARQ